MAASGKEKLARGAQQRQTARGAGAAGGLQDGIVEVIVAGIFGSESVYGEGEGVECTAWSAG